MNVSVWKSLFFLCAFINATFEFLGHSALHITRYRRMLALWRGLSVCVFVSLSVPSVCCAKTAELMEMLFGMFLSYAC